MITVVLGIVMTQVTGAQVIGVQVAGGQTIGAIVAGIQMTGTQIVVGVLEVLEVQEAIVDGYSSGIALIITLVIIAFSVYLKMSRHMGRIRHNQRVGRAMQTSRETVNRAQRNSRLPNEPEIYEGFTELKVQEIDELFEKEDFNQFVKMVFTKMQQAWTKRDWAEIEPFETNELFEQHKLQVQGYINSGTINILDRVCILYSKLYKFEQSDGKDVLTAVVKARMKDYIIDEKTREVLQGDASLEKVKLYKLEFIRKTGVKTKPEGEEVNAINCPNCGAPTKITTSGKCEYCGSIITTEEYDWVLRNYEPFK